VAAWSGKRTVEPLLEAGVAASLDTIDGKYEIDRSV
jgi:hypothetical protein